MAYQVLARKWRPKTFADLVGQQHVVKALKNALDEGRLHHAYLLTGTRGVGKTTIARILAKSLNCLDAQHGEPCGKCTTCQDIDQGRFVDLLEIDAASNTGIDNIREVLENAQYAPSVGKYKVYIIDEVHMLSKSAFNAMLKTLEEPPEHVKFILATTDPQKVPITVLSRCLQFVLKNMTAQQVSEHLAYVLNEEKIPYESLALGLLGRSASGSMRDALSLLDQAIAMGSGQVTEHDVRQMIGAVDKSYLYELIEFLIQKNGEALLAKAREMSVNGIGLDSALNELALIFQRLALLKIVPNAISPDDAERERLQDLAQSLSDEQIQLYYQCVIHGKQDLSFAPDEYAGFVMTLLRMLAFAPFTAENTPQNAHISGVSSQKNHSNHQEVSPEEQPVEAEKSVAVSAQTMSLNYLANTNADVVKREFKPEQLPPPYPQEIKRSSETHFSEKKNQPEPINQTIESQEEKLEIQIESQQAKTVASVEVPEIIESVEPIELVEDFGLPELSDSDNMDGMDERDWVDDDFHLSHYLENDFSHEDVISTTPLAYEEEPEAENVIELESVQVDFQQIELTKENWFTIALGISPQVSGAQMFLLEMAWVDYTDGKLILALNQEKTKNISQKQEFIRRIEQTLRDYYNETLRLQVIDWQENSDWETLSMYQERVKQEKRQQARVYLEKDEVIQLLMQETQARWRDNSLILK